jgi:hypothetical protein
MLHDMTTLNTKQVGSNKSSEIRGRFVGFSHHVGHALTFKILTDDTRHIIHRSRVRLQGWENNLKLEAEAGNVRPEFSSSQNATPKETTSFYDWPHLQPCSDDPLNDVPKDNEDGEQPDNENGEHLDNENGETEELRLPCYSHRWKIPPNQPSRL